MKPRALVAGHRQAGASLVEVLVALLLLSLGILSLCGVLIFAVQSPKLSSHRAAAVHLAANHIESMRANSAGFYSGRYVTPLRWASVPKSTPLAPCTHPDCASGALADQDTALLSEAVRMALPNGGMQVNCQPSPCTATSHGNVWIVWQEPATYAALEAGTSNACPPETPALPTNVQTRCIHLRFAL